MPATDKTLRNLNKVHIVFALSTLGLLLVTVWMMAADHADPWRRTQQTKFNIDEQRLSGQVTALESNESYKEKSDALNAQLDEAEKKHASKKAEIDALQPELKKARLEADLAERAAKIQRGIRDMVRANYDIGVRDNVNAEKLKSLKEAFDNQQEVVDSLETDFQSKSIVKDAVEKKNAALNADVEKVVEEKKKLNTELDRVIKARDKIRPESAFSRIKRDVMQWPIIDGFNSPVKIKQDWIPGLRQKLGMAQSARFDRCRTCHMNIELTEAGNKPAYPLGHPEGDDIAQWVKQNEYPHPYATHPRTDVYLTATSPHPVEKFGCTICHEGQGSGTEFSNAAHYPNDPHIHHEWEKKHHFATNHYWEYPMYPERFRESSCLKCHHSVDELGVNPKYGATAPKVYEGYRLIQQYGCFGCHEIQGYTAGRAIGPDMRLEPTTVEERKKIAADPNLVAGKMRKVGPSLRHVKYKTTEEWVAYWTEEPKRFRPSTRMPQFFHLANQEDGHAQELTPVELAGISQYLFDKSEALELLQPAEGYKPNAERGKDLFAVRGCLACHSRGDFPETKADFGPDLSKINQKIRPGEDGFKWLYTWLRDPERHHPRTRMPNVFLDAYTEKDQTIDPAADIAAYLLQGGPGEYKSIELNPYIGVVVDDRFEPSEAVALGLDAPRGVRIVDVMPGSPAMRASKFVEVDREGDSKAKRELKIDDVIIAMNRVPVESAAQMQEIIRRTPIGEPIVLTIISDRAEEQVSVIVDEPLNDLVRLYLNKVMKQSETEKVLSSGQYPVARDKIPGDEIELASANGAGVSGDEWRTMKLNYVGRRSISRYGCYGCHDIGGFDSARPIGTTLQDWGRKDTTRLAPEHIEEYLHHHGEADGSSTHDRVAEAIGRAARGDFKTKEEEEKAMSAAFFYEDLMHHGRAGFLWQKLRSPRSYDYKKVETKAYDERLRMPRFPLTEGEIEAISTFVLGLVAEPPAAEYIYKPNPAAAARIQGEQLLLKYNCVGCHMLELPEIKYGAELDSFTATPVTPADHPEALEMLLRMKPAHNGVTGEKIERTVEGEKKTLDVISFHGLAYARPTPDTPPEDREYNFDVWEPVKVGDKLKLPFDRVNVAESVLVSESPGRGGAFTEWLVGYLQKSGRAGTPHLARQKSAPTLYKEGYKVQTPWLYQFLRDPDRIRYEAILRMPRFNMSTDEAQALANYFAAADGTQFPYQLVPEREPEYVEAKNEELKADLGDNDYLTEAWKVFNAPLCIKCHSLGGRTFKISDPTKDVHGPDLRRVADRLRPEWTLLWLYRPQWITPYTSMPPNFPKDQVQFKDLFKGDSNLQTIAVRDALMNYHKLMERDGKIEYQPPGGSAPKPETPPAAAGN